MKVPNDERSVAIKGLYKDVLNREADLPGLAAYYQSGLSEKEIEADLKGSGEYQVLTGAKPKTSTGLMLDNFLIGSPPRSDEDCKALLDEGVKVVIGIGRSPFITYNQEAFEEHFIIPIGEYGKKDLDDQALNKCIKTLHEKTITEDKKTYLHSVDGLGDVVLVAAMFRCVVRDVSFTSSLYHILASGLSVDLDRDLVTPVVVKQALEVKGKMVGKDFLGSAPIYDGVPKPVLDPCHR